MTTIEVILLVITATTEVETLDQPANAHTFPSSIATQVVAATLKLVGTTEVEIQWYHYYYTY